MMVLLGCESQVLLYMYNNQKYYLLTSMQRMFYLSVLTFKDPSLKIFSSDHGDGDIKCRQAWQPPAIPAPRRQRRGIPGASSLARQTRISELHIHPLRGPATVYSGEQMRKIPNIIFKPLYICELFLKKGLKINGLHSYLMQL